MAGSFLDNLNNLSSNFGGFRMPTKNDQNADGLPDMIAAPTPQAAAPVDPLQALQDQLFQQMNSVPSYRTPIDQLRQQATAQMNGQYNPLIDALKTQMGQTQSRAATNQKTVKSMYNDLSKDYNADIPGMQQQAQQDQQQTNQRYDNAQKSIQQDYNNNSQQQQALLQKLGIQAAAPDANTQQQADQTYYQGQSDLEQQSALDALKQQSNAQTDYQHNLSDTTQMAGTNRAADIGTQLEQYLQQANGQLGTLQAQRSGGIESLLAQMQGQDATQANTQRQQEIDNLMALSNFQLNATKAQNSAANSSSNQLFKNTNGPSGAANYLAQTYGKDTNTASQIMQQITDEMGAADVIAGQHKTGHNNISGQDTFTANTDQYVSDLLKRRMSQAGGFSDMDMANAVNALLAYMGKQR